MVMLNKINSQLKDADWEANKCRSSSTLVNSRRKNAGGYGALSRERRVELGHRFGFMPYQLGVYENLVGLLRSLREEEKSALISSLLDEANKG